VATVWSQTVREFSTAEPWRFHSEGTIVPEGRRRQRGTKNPSLPENIKRGIRQKLRNGIWPNRPPVGYFNDRNNRCVAVQPEKAELVRKAFED
jgi:hypothetical protein